MPRTRYVPWNGNLSLRANSALVCLLGHPLWALLAPALVLFWIAYPSLGELANCFVRDAQLAHNPLAVGQRSIRSVAVDRALHLGPANATIRVFDVPFDSTLPVDSLNQVLAIENSLLHGTNHTVLVHSLVDFWERNSTLWTQDPNIFKTIQFAHERGVLDDVVTYQGSQYVDGVLTGVSTAHIVLIYPPNCAVDKRIALNAKRVGVQMADAGPIDYTLRAKRSSALEMFLMGLIPWSTVLFMAVIIMNVQSLCCRFGVLLSFVTQFVLCVCASAQITRTFMSDFMLLQQLPPVQLLLIPLLMAFESSGRITVNYTRTRAVESFSLRLRMAVLNSFSETLDIVMAVELILGSVLMASVSRLTSQYCLFTMGCILLNFGMTFTFFTIVLALDFKRLQTEAANGSPLEWLPSSHNPFVQNVVQNVLRVKFPIFGTFLHELLVVIVLFLVFVRWTAGDHLFEYNHLDLFVNKRGFVHSLEQMIGVNATDVLRVQFFAPVAVGSLPEPLSSKWTYVYILELGSISLFLICGAITIIKLIFKKELKASSGAISTGFIIPVVNHDNMVLNADNELSILQPAFNFKELVNGHILDVVKIYTSACPFVVSVGLDHHVLVWSPMTNPIPSPVQLPITMQSLPISSVAMSESGSLIAVFLNSGKLKCWSRLTMSWIWDIDLGEDAVPLETFFRKKKLATKGGRRTLVSRTMKTRTATPTKRVTPTNSTAQASSAISETHLPSKPPSKLPATASAKTALVSSKVPSKTPATKHTKDVLSSTTNFASNRIGTQIRARTSRTPSMDSNFDHSSDLGRLDANTRMEFVIVLKNGEIVSVDCQNGSIERTRLSQLPLITARKLLTPRVNDRIVGIEADGILVVATAVNNKWISRSVKIDNTSYNMGKSLVTPAVLLREFETSRAAKHVVFDERVAEVDDVVMETVPFVGMIVRAFLQKAQLVDVQTGIILKEWAIGQFKRDSFSVFHPEPSHCRFCGCASVGSFSVAYTELETSTLIMHTFSIDNRAKNSICLRVERDSRETRCLGFASVSEHQHWLSNVEGWCATDLNMLMGVRRKDQTEKEQTDETVLRNRKANIQKTAENPKISDLWEGWTMSCDGHVRFYDISEGHEPQVLIKQPGPVQKFGHKSIVVPFGNVMRIFYLGNDSLIEEGEPDHESLSPMSQTSSSLSFINRRRKLRLKKYELTHSTKFDEGGPDSQEGAL